MIFSESQYSVNHNLSPEYVIYNETMTKEQEEEQQLAGLY